jgi:hypothetical protein
MKWLSAHLTDNRFVVVTFVALLLLNAYLLSNGYYG